MKFHYFVIVICFFYLCNGDDEFSQTIAQSKSGDFEDFEYASDTALKIYQKLFASKRKEQWNAIEVIQSYPKERVQHLIELLVEGMSRHFQESKQVIERFNFRPGMPFPDEKAEELREALAKTLENAAFFADLALHFPDTIKKIYKSDSNFKTSVNWAIVFSNSTQFYESKTTQVMHLVGQELGLIEKEPSYVNPYAINVQMESAQEENISQVNGTTKKKTRKKQSKGPRLQRGTKTEL